MTSFRRSVTPAERRARLGRRHLLVGSARVRTPEEVAGALIGLHATDPATVFLSAAARMAEPEVAAVERALYEERTLARIRCMRRTMFVLPAAFAPEAQAAVGRYAYMDRGKALDRLREAAGWDELRYTAAEQDALALLAERGEATAAEFAAAVPALREQIVAFPGKSYESRQRVASTVLGVLAAEGRIRRARPAGNWTSAQFRWALAEPLPELPASESKAALARRYLSAFGPVTEADLKWWTGWTLAATRKAIAASGAEAVSLDEGTGYLLPEDVEPVSCPEPWVTLLPSLDATPMGWRQRDWYLDADHTPALFDRNGNIGPTIWADGRIIGAWAQRPDGSINHRLFTDPGREIHTALDGETARMTTFLRGTRVTPCYRTPLERQLSA
ncbi:AlkZ family DNA glycosylase [Streptomyces sp. ISL-98]|uniref:winged helix DNA-binding domain-containing protein n=1 Tax=Streptomyces sp. ISL-98 TaxID=2819192 RepID=UPI001BE509E7|nr:winged helix DNA-binding domain-containing protein [Streptomyces sp. ISL-98]MBT2505830.1 AlkZ family DNA glycosylase [Streptomyces sp. ISL-98]